MGEVLFLVVAILAIVVVGLLFGAGLAADTFRAAAVDQLATWGSGWVSTWSASPRAATR